MQLFLLFHPQVKLFSTGAKNSKLVTPSFKLSIKCDLWSSSLIAIFVLLTPNRFRFQTHKTRGARGGHSETLYSWMSALISTSNRVKTDIYLFSSISRPACVSWWVLKLSGDGAPRSVWVQQTMDRPEPEKKKEMSVTMPGSCQLEISK